MFNYCSGSSGKIARIHFFVLAYVLSTVKGLLSNDHFLVLRAVSHII